MNQIFFLKQKWIEIYRKKTTIQNWLDGESAKQLRAMYGRVSHYIQIMKTNTDVFK